MTPEDIDKLTIAEVRAIAERANESLKQLRELQALLGVQSPIGVTSAPLAARAFSPDGFRAPQPVPGSPFPCPACGRAATERPGEATQPQECLTCGNHLPLAPGQPGLIMSNKGPLVPDAEMLARRQALISAPAFGEDGEPLP